MRFCREGYTTAPRLLLCRIYASVEIFNVHLLLDWMYNTSSTTQMFKDLRVHQPHLIPVYRFFYYTPSLIWFGGRLIPIVIALTATGAEATRLGDASSTTFLALSPFSRMRLSHIASRVCASSDQCSTTNIVNTDSTLI